MLSYIKVTKTVYKFHNIYPNLISKKNIWNYFDKCMNFNQILQNIDL